MKTRILLIAIIAIACIGCKQGNQPEYVFEKITLSDEDKAALDQIFSEGNGAIRDYVIKAEEFRDAHTIVEIIGSKKELLAISPKGVKLPDLDFNKYCIVWAGVQTGSSGNSFTGFEISTL